MIDRRPHLFRAPRARALAGIGGLCAALLAACSCSKGSAAPAPSTVEFDQERAWKHLLAQVELGPRPSGSAALEETRLYLEQELRRAGLEPVRETFTAETPKGEIEMANVYADLPGRQKGGDPPRTVILLSHYDTKRMDGHPDQKLRTGSFVGANDGASSTAVLLELARVLAAGPKRAVTYRFLFADGEEAVRWTWMDPDNRYGSRHHALELRKRGDHRKVGACVVIDMVGDADLKLTDDTYSDRQLLEIFFKAARRIGLGEHVGGRRTPVLDDHISFIDVDIPSCDLIDLDYEIRDEDGRIKNLWHTLDDTPAHCSPDSLGIAGRIVLAGLPQLEATVTR